MDSSAVLLRARMRDRHNNNYGDYDFLLDARVHACLAVVSVADNEAMLVSECYLDVMMYPYR